MRRRALLLIIPLVVVTPAFAQAAKGPSDEERAKVYLTDKQAAQRSFQQGLQANGRGRDVAAMSAGVRAAHPARGRALKHSAATDQAIVDAYYTDVALELAALGFSNGDLQSPRGAGLIRAAIAKRTAAADYADLALLSDTVGVGTVTAVDVAGASPDGLGGRVSVRLERPIKGNLKAGDQVDIVMVSGSRSASGQLLLDADEYIPAVGASVALFASRAAYAPNRSWRGRGSGDSPRSAMRLVNLLEVSGDTVIAHDAFLPNTTLSALAALGDK